MLPRLTIHRALIGAIVLSILAGLVPAGIALDRRLARALEERARTDLRHAPELLADRQAAYSDAQMMHAKEFSQLPGLAEAVAGDNQPAVLRIVEAARASLGPGVPLIVNAADSVLVGARPDTALILATQRGEMPVRLNISGGFLRNVAVAPLMHLGRWVGTVGVATPVDNAEAEALKGLTRSDIIIVAAGSTTIAATTLDTTTAHSIRRALESETSDTAARDVTVEGDRYFVLQSTLGNAARAIFVRPARVELAVLPSLRRTAAVSALLALVTALALGGWLALRVSRPVRQLASAATAMRDESFDAALPATRVVEIARVTEQFHDMRLALRARLDELRVANEALVDRNARLVTLQEDLIQRERFVATGRLVTQLAHEIRNPVAALRNCLEVLRQRLKDDPEGLEFADMAINELLRMHELAEQTLDVGRPKPPTIEICRPGAVAQEVARLVSTGVPSSELGIEVKGNTLTTAHISGDSLKQVLLNLIQNAREACAAASPPVVPARLTIDIQVDEAVRVIVDDNGPGVPASTWKQVFDPFFSTKTAVNGVGLGLFVAQGLLRAVDGRMIVASSPSGGARFVLEVPQAATTGARAPLTRA